MQVPSVKMERAWTQLASKDGSRAFNNTWSLTHTREHGQEPDVWELTHYGDAVLRLVGGEVDYACARSSSDRDGINGLLALAGLDGSCQASFAGGVAMWSFVTEDGWLTVPMGEAFGWEGGL